MKIIAEPKGGGDGYWTIRMVETVEEIIGVFGDPPHADDLNWLFLSTSGIHGTYTTLDDMDAEDSGITVLAICPRILRMTFGHVDVTPDQAETLRGLVRETLAAVARSQEGNT